MESLLCDEVWPSSPALTDGDDPINHKQYCGSSMYATTATKEDYDQALAVFLEKETSYMPQPNYVDNLCSNNLAIARFKTIQWFIKCRSRLNLSLGTVFYAANYLDRFISMTHCINGWKYWKVELLSIACLSIASKFNDTCTPTLLEIQKMEDLDHSFESSTIQRMEMMLLQTLGWRLASTTAYSYLEVLLTWTLEDSLKPQLHEEFIARVNKLLLGAISDTKLLEFRPSVVAISALQCSLDMVPSTASDGYFTCLKSLLDDDQKAELVKCHKMMMEAQSVDDSLYKLIAHGLFHYCPSSPTTVLLKERFNFCDFHVDISLFKMSSGQNINAVESTRIKKRKREGE